MSGYRVERVESVAALRALAPEWRQLEDASDNRLPFRTFEWNDAWWQHFCEDRLSVRDRLALRAVRDPKGTLVGAFPLMVTERPARGPVRVRCLHALGADPNITELRSPLVHPDHGSPVHEAVALDLRADASRFDWCEWSGVEKNAPGEEVLARLPGLHWTREVPNFILPLAPTWEEFRKGLKHNVRESLRKCYNSLKRDNHVFSIEVVEKPEDVRRALGHFFHLHASRAELSGTVVHRNVFDSPAAQHFLQDVCERLALRGSTRIFLLSVAGEVLAMRIGFVFGDSIYLYYSGYDPEWARYSIMTTLLAEIFKHSMERGVKTANLSTGNDISKTRWGPTEHIYRDARLVSPSRQSHWRHDAYRRLLEAKEDERVRRWLGRHLARRQAGRSRLPQS